MAVDVFVIAEGGRKCRENCIYEDTDRVNARNCGDHIILTQTCIMRSTVGTQITSNKYYNIYILCNANKTSEQKIVSDQFTFFEKALSTTAVTKQTSVYS